MPHAKLLSAMNPILSSVESESFKLPSEATQPEKSKEMHSIMSNNMSSFSEQENQITMYFLQEENADLQKTAFHFDLGLEQTGSIIAKSIRKIRYLKRFNKS